MANLKTIKQKIVCSTETCETVSVEQHELSNHCNSEKLMEAICSYLIDKVISPKLSVSN